MLEQILPFTGFAPTPTSSGTTSNDLPNIVDIATSSDDFNILVQALSTAGLVDTIQNLPDITVFAPTDAAFTQLAVDLGFDGDTSDEDAVFDGIVAALTELADDDDPIPLLTEILLYHVSDGAKSAEEIDDADEIETLLDGATFGSDGTELSDNEPDLDNPNIVTPDVPASNGTVQVIDRVLLPLDVPESSLPTLTGIVAASGGEFDDNTSDFDILLNAVQAADLAGALDDPDADLTVFAPNDAAFIGLAQALGFEGSDEGEAFAFIVDALVLLSGGGDPIPLLTDILLFHVAPSALDSTAVLGATSIPTLFGTDLGVDGASLVDQDPDLPNPSIIDVDIAASNGIAHVLDGVLLPVDVLQSNGAEDVDFIVATDENEEFRTGKDNDLVSGLGGRDNMRLGRGDDIGLGGDNNDLIRGNSGNDSIHGGAGNDVLRGGRGDDKVSGGEGRDLIFGRSGNDILEGGADADIFVFNPKAESATITDFEVGVDLIQLRGFGKHGFENVEDIITDSEDGALITAGDVTILLEGVSAAEISESDFLFF